MQLYKDDLQKAYQVKKLIEKDFYKKYSHEDLARLYGTNKLKLKFAFKVVAKDPIYEYHTKIRIEHAKSFLENSDLSIEQIAKRIGIDKSNLNKQFKRLTGKTPSEWRKVLSSNIV
jgi:transcriptional regulator GlxA family with amidase domain